MLQDDMFPIMFSTLIFRVVCLLGLAGLVFSAAVPDDGLPNTSVIRRQTSRREVVDRLARPAGAKRAVPSGTAIPYVPCTAFDDRRSTDSCRTSANAVTFALQFASSMPQNSRLIGTWVYPLSTWQGEFMRPSGTLQQANTYFLDAEGHLRRTSDSLYGACGSVVFACTAKDTGHG